MLEWCGAVLLAAGLLVLLLLPGYLLLSALGARRLLALVGSPGVSIVCVTAATLVMPALGLRWTWLSAAVLLLLPCLVSGALALALTAGRRASRATGPASGPVLEEGGRQAGQAAGARPRRRTVVAAFVGVFLAAAVQLVVLVRALRVPSAILQNHDVMFHLNYIAHIALSGDASPLGSARAVNGGTYYPNLWHTLAASLPGVDVPTAFNTVVLLAALFLLPIGCSLLARALGGGPWALVLAPLAGSATVWFPALPLYFHGQVPTALSVALALFALAALLEWYQQKASPVAASAVVLAVVGAGTAHAGAGQVLVVVTAALALLWSGQRLSCRGRAARWYAASLLPALLAVLALWAMCSLPALGAMAAYERGSRPVGEVLVDVLTLAPLPDGPAPSGRWLHYWPLALGALAGVYLAARRRRWEILAVWGSLAALVLLTASPPGWWQVLVGGWWRDESRYLGLLAVLAGVLAASAAEAAVLWCWRHRGSAAVPTRVLGVLLGAVTAVAVALTAGVAVTDASTWARRGYDVSALVHAPWLTPQEERFIRDVAQTLPVNAVVYGYPASGAGLFPVLTGTDSAHHTVTSRGALAEEAYLAYHFEDILTDPKVCQIIRASGGTPVFYQDRSITPEMVTPDFSGYGHVDLSRGFTLLASQEDYSLWAITACG